MSDEIEKEEMIDEIESLREKISELEKENSDLKESLDMKNKELELERNRFKIDSDLNKKLLDQSHQRIKELESYKLAMEILEGVLNRIN